MKKWFLLFIFYSFTVNSSANDINDTRFIDEINIGIGQSKDNIDIYRLAAKKDFDKTFFESDIGWLSGYYEGSLNYWERDGDDIYGIALSPVFVYYFGDKSSTILPYVEGGIGVTYISDTKLQSRDMTTNFQFEDRIGVGVRKGSFDLSARYMHYSNASIKKPNDGIDIFIFTLSYIF